MKAFNGGKQMTSIWTIPICSGNERLRDENGDKLHSTQKPEELLKRVLSIQSQYDNMLVGTKANLFRELALIKDFFATKSIVQVIDFPFFFLAVAVIFIISPMIALVPILIAILVLIFNFAMQVPISNLKKIIILKTHLFMQLTL
jgi:ABC-type bacteriocin/lantibiotic exporter with double-glycine peptidase domain